MQPYTHAERRRHGAMWPTWLKHSLALCLTSLLGQAGMARAGVHDDPDALFRVTQPLPVLDAQEDGVLYLYIESAGVVSDAPDGLLLDNPLGKTTINRHQRNLSYWTDHRDVPAWRVTVRDGGTYRVLVQHNQPGRSFMQLVATRQGGAQAALEAELAPTGSWRIFNSTAIGEITLEPGEHVITFASRRPARGYLMGLRDLRLAPTLDTAEQTRTARLFDQLGLREDAAVRALEERLAELKRELTIAGKWIEADPAAFTSYDQFVQRDRAVASLPQLKAAITDVAQERRDTLAARVAAAQSDLTPEDFALLNRYLYLNDLDHLGWKTYPKTHYWMMEESSEKAASDEANTTLFPVGGNDVLPRQTLDLDTVEGLPMPVAPDQEQRRAAFREALSPEGLEALCHAFARVVDMEAPGMDVFAGHYRRGAYQAALDAYRDRFFSRLKDPEAHGLPVETIFFHHARGPVKPLGWPAPSLLEALEQGQYILPVRGGSIRAKIGLPGEVLWAPVTLSAPEGAVREDGYRMVRDPYWSTEEGRVAARQVFVYEQLRPRRGVGPFKELLNSYTLTGNRDHLNLWADYLTDYTLHGIDDQDNAGISIRSATENDSTSVYGMLTLFRVILDERPAFAEDLPSHALVRYLMLLVSDYFPQTIRARRAEQANWGITAISHMALTSSFLSEFKAMRYYNREAWRLWRYNMITHLTLDGENIEAWDTGHGDMDVIWANETIPNMTPPDDAHPLEFDDFWDQLRTRERNLLVHLSPSGNYWDSWAIESNPDRNTLKDVWLSEDRFNVKDPILRVSPVLEEPEARRRVDIVLGEGQPGPKGPPSRFSDIAPYAMMAYMRESWQPEAGHLILDNFMERSQVQGAVARGFYASMEQRTFYSLYRNRRGLLTASAVIVDGLPPNRFADNVRTGGKTEFGAQAGRHVSPSLFHTSDRFDFVQAVQDAPYTLKNYLGKYADGRHDALGLGPSASDGVALTNITATRRVFQVRGEGVYFVQDHMDAKEPHQYTKHFMMPVYLPPENIEHRLDLLVREDESLLDIQPEAGRIRMDVPGMDKVTIHVVGDDVEIGEGYDASSGTPQPVNEELLSERLKQAVEGEGYEHAAMRRRVFVRHVALAWTNSAAPLLVIHSREDGVSELAERVDVAAPNGVTGVDVRLPSGAHASFRTAPDRAPVALQAGGVQARAETMLAVERADGWSGIVLGGTALQAGDRVVALTDAHVEFHIPRDRHGEVVLTPIHAALDTIRILPEQTAFVDTLDVRVEIPDLNRDEAVEVRYTLDGSDPTLDSPLYKGRVTIDETTLFKARPFRAGLAETPWNVPEVDAGKVISALFYKAAPTPARAVAQPEPGLRYHYYEGNWRTLFSYAGEPDILTPVSTGTVSAPLNPQDIEKVRKTDRAYALRYEGYIEAPETGVYTFKAPKYLYESIMDAGYDLRVFVAGQEWKPNPMVHAENQWSMALEKGLHPLVVSFVDYRWKTFRNEYWMPWFEEQMYTGWPALHVSGPDMEPVVLRYWNE